MPIFFVWKITEIGNLRIGKHIQITFSSFMIKFLTWSCTSLLPTLPPTIIFIPLITISIYNNKKVKMKLYIGSNDHEGLNQTLRRSITFLLKRIMERGEKTRVENYHLPSICFAISCWIFELFGTIIFSSESYSIKANVRPSVCMYVRFRGKRDFLRL